MDAPPPRLFHSTHSREILGLNFSETVLRTRQSARCRRQPISLLCRDSPPWPLDKPLGPCATLATFWGCNTCFPAASTQLMARPCWLQSWQTQARRKYFGANVFPSILRTG